MYVDKLTASYVKDLLGAMKQLKLREVILLAQDKDGHPYTVKLSISMDNDSYFMCMTPDECLNPGGTKDVIYSWTKKEFIEKFKGSKMYMLKIIQTEHVE